MNKVDLFKEFVRNNSFLLYYIRNGDKTWQEMYQIYDLYGEDEDAWRRFLVREDKNDNNKKNNNYCYYLVNMAKKVDVNKVQEGITSLQKTLGLFGELFNNNSNHTNSNNYNPRPLYRRFDD